MILYTYMAPILCSIFVNISCFIITAVMMEKDETQKRKSLSNL